MGKERTQTSNIPAGFLSGFLVVAAELICRKTDGVICRAAPGNAVEKSEPALYISNVLIAILCTIFASTLCFFSAAKRGFMP